MRLRDRRADPSGTTLYAARAKFRSKRSGMVADRGHVTVDVDVHRYYTGSDHHAQRALLGRFKEPRRFHRQHHVRVIFVHKQQNLPTARRSHVRKICILDVRVRHDPLPGVLGHRDARNQGEDIAGKFSDIVRLLKISQNTSILHFALITYSVSFLFYKYCTTLCIFKK